MDKICLDLNFPPKFSVTQDALHICMISHVYAWLEIAMNDGRISLCTAMTALYLALKWWNATERYMKNEFFTMFDILQLFCGAKFLEYFWIEFLFGP